MDISESTQMKAILGPESEPFETFISDHMERLGENDSILNMMKLKDPDSLALKLSDFLSSSQNSDFREKYAKILYELLVGDGEGCIWNNLSSSTQSTIKCILIVRIRLEESESIIKQLCYSFSNLFLPSDSWPELLPFLQECVNSNSNKLRDSFFLIFSGFSEGLCETLVPDIMISFPVYLNTLNDDTLDPQVRVAVLTTEVRFILYLPSSNDREWFQNLLPAMLRALTDAVRNDAAQNMLNLFIELAKKEPRFFRRQLVDVVSDMFEIAEREDKALGSEEKGSGMMKKLPLFINNCFAMILKLLLDIEDEPSWYSTDTEHEYAGETENYAFGEECLERFSAELGGKTIASIAMEQLEAYFDSPEWEKRHAALRAFYQIAEGSWKPISLNSLFYLSIGDDKVFGENSVCGFAFLPRSSSSSQMGRYGYNQQLSNDFHWEWQEEYHNQVVPVIVAAMDDFPRVQLVRQISTSSHYSSLGGPSYLVFVVGGGDRYLVELVVLGSHLCFKNLCTISSLIAIAAACALIQFFDPEMPETLVPYLDQILNKLLVLLQKAAVEALIDIAEFSNCICNVGLAVGKEKFRDDLEKVMEVLKSLQESDTNIHILKACHSICKCIGKEFIPYMSTVMPPLVEYAQLEIDKDLDDECYDSIHEVKLGDGTIRITRKDLLDGKSTACNVLVLFAQTLQEAFYPWISQAASILIPLMNFYMDYYVRGSAISAMSCLLRSAKLSEEKGIAQDGIQLNFKQLSEEIILALGEALYTKPETDICTVILSELNKCLKICRPLLNEAHVRSIIDWIKHVIRESSLRKGELIDREKSEDFDAEEADLLTYEKEPEEIFSNAIDILITLIETFKDAFLPFHEELSSDLMPMRGKDETTGERTQRIHIFNAFMEHCDEVDASNDDNPYVRQAAFCGLGLCAQYGGYDFKPFIGEALSRINVVIRHSKALEPDNVTAYDSAVSALGCICQFHLEDIDSVQIIPAWLNCLPIKDDMNKAKAVLDQLCSMVERSDRELLGPNYLHLPKVISVFTEVLCAGDDVVTEETANRIIHLLRHFKETIPPTLLASAQALLLPQQEMELESILSPDHQEDVTFQLVQ
ncbi:hypothetical protein H5410_000159 [Solanum commersonii]|uniref:IPO4/5-like TPR repeats domain-containing protein n=1 Tax=Solanum commersonii TaxID=4109 RepID=A0A9J6AW07_SOLCO|nr:hypothetical protein H5410_000159 [Solanum commersonii]